MARLENSQVTAKTILRTFPAGDELAFFSGRLVPNLSRLRFLSLAGFHLERKRPEFLPTPRRRRRFAQEQSKGYPMNGPSVSSTWIVRLGSQALLLLCLAGCHPGAASPGDAGASGTFSEVYSRFDPANEFLRLGFKVDSDVEGGGISPRELYGWKPIQGSLELPSGLAGCEAVAQAIRRSLDRALGADCDDELNRQRERHPGQPLYGMLRYVKEGMRGHVYVWLFPDQTETKINYAILLREESPHGNSLQTAGCF
jgi:hypothetical protein